MQPFGTRPADPEPPAPLPQFQAHTGYGPPPTPDVTGPYPIVQLGPVDVPRPRPNLKPLWIALVVLLVIAVVGGGGAWYYFERMDSAIDAERATVALPDRLADLAKTDKPELTQIADTAMDNLALQEYLTNIVGGAYADPTDPKQNVVIVAASGRVEDPDAEVQSLFSGMGPGIEVRGITDYPPGGLGGRVRCGSIESAGGEMSACGWADHGSLGIGLFMQRPIDESALLFVHIRQLVVTR